MSSHTLNIPPPPVLHPPHEVLGHRVLPGPQFLGGSGSGSGGETLTAAGGGGFSVSALHLSASGGRAAADTRTPRTHSLLELVSLHCIISTRHHGKCDFL